MEIDGSGLANRDVVAVMMYCPESRWRAQVLMGPLNQDDLSPPNTEVKGWPLKGMSQHATSDGRLVSWGSEIITSPVGSYPICWCSAAITGSVHRCEKPQDFYVSIGEIIVAGPAVEHSYRGCAGHPLSLAGTKGYGIKQTDQLTVVMDIENCTSPVSIVLEAAAASVFPNSGIAFAENEPHPPTGDSARVKTMDFSFKSELIIRGGSNFILCWYPAQEPGEPAPVPQVLGQLQIDGPIGDQMFTQTAGSQLIIDPLLGVALAAGDRLVATTASKCGTSVATAAIGGEGISFESTDGSTYTWPGLALAAGGNYLLCWCRANAAVSPCRRPEDFLIKAGELLLVSPSLGHRFTCFSAQDCTISLKWPPGVKPQNGSLAVSASTSCTGALSPDFPSGPATGVSTFTWSRIPATAGHHALCWCSELDCSVPGNFTHEVGQLEVLGPNAGHSFTCSWSKGCTVNPIQGTQLYDGQRLLFTSRKSCRNDDAIMLTKPNIYTTWDYHGQRASTPAEAGLSEEIQVGVVAQVSSHCKDYYTGCSHTWTSDLMGGSFAVPYLSEGYRLCWCHSGSCTKAEYVVEVGTLMVDGHPPLPWTLNAQQIMSPPELGAQMR